MQPPTDATQLDFSVPNSLELPREAPFSVSEARDVDPPQPDWQTDSDEAFLKAARAVFAENAELLRRLA